MAETGGPIYEGVGRPEEAKPRVVDAVRERVKHRLEQNSGVIVEQKWMDAYQKTVDALDEGKRKNIVKKLRPLAVGVAKVNRIGSAVADFTLRFGGLFHVIGGAIAIVNPQAIIDRMPLPVYTRGQMRGIGGVRVGQGLLEGAAGKRGISRIASGWLADIAGAGSEKVAQISNKILGGKPKPEVNPA